MYGLVNKAVEDLVVTNFGEDKWEAIKAKAGIDIDVFISNEGYPDDITYRLVGAAVEILDLPADTVLAAFGEHWVLKIAVPSYGALMKSGGRTFKEFLVNLPNFHTRIAMIYPKLEPPRFACSNITDDSLHLHYMTHRPGLTAFVSGILQGLAKLYDSSCSATIIARKDAGADHDVFEVRWNSDAPA